MGAYVPGPGDTATWPTCAGHPHDPRSDECALLDDAEDLLAGAFSPFAPANMREALAEMPDEWAQRASDAWQGGNNAQFCTLVQGWVLAYWDGRAVDAAQRAADKDRAAWREEAITERSK